MSEEVKTKKRRMRNANREKKKFLDDGRDLITAALNAGKSTRSEISKATGLKLHEINSIFEQDRDLWASYTVRRRSIVDIAADNITDIITDKNHPQNFQASKYVLQNYKSDLDQVLESSSGEVEVAIQGGESTASPVTITFTSSKKEE